MILPTIELRHRVTGRKCKVNQTDYARDIGKWFEWEMITMKHGDATDEQVEWQATQSDLEKHRRTDAKRQRWSGDAQRAFDERSIIVTG